jgi:pimeloyl-ACP methyl ester carboxylesterase
VYVFDLLGFGASDRRADQDVSLAAHGRRLAELLDFWGLERPAVVAHDIGGAVALRAHLLHGRPVAALALVDVVALGPWGSPFFRLVRDHDAVFEQLPAAIHEGVVRAYVGTAGVRPLDRDVEDALVSPWLGPVGQSAFYRQIAQADERHTEEIEPLWPDRRTHARRLGRARPLDSGAAWPRAGPTHTGARLELLPTAGHLVPEEEPEELARLLAAHLSAIPDY